MAKKYKERIVYTDSKCAASSSRNDCKGPTETHHIFFGTGNRHLSEEDGLVCPLCTHHHRGIPGGVHGGNKELDLELKAAAQKVYMEVNHASIEDFRKRYGKSWI